MWLWIGVELMCLWIGVQLDMIMNKYVSLSQSFSASETDSKNGVIEQIFELAKWR
jgi:hypothetical protein